MKNFLKILLLFSFFLLSRTSSLFGDNIKQTSNKSALYFSLIPKKDIEQQIQELRPLIQFLEKKLDQPVKIVRPKSYQSVIEGILSENIDFAILGSASYAKAYNRDQRIEAFASFAKRKSYITPEGIHYYSVLFTLKDNKFDSIDELKNQKVALTDPASTSGSVIPKMFFSKEINSTLNEYFSSMIYMGSHDRAIKSVIAKQVDAAFVSSSRIDEAIRKATLKKIR